MLRWSEWVAAGFLTYATVMAPFPKTFLLNAIVVLGFLLIIRQPASRNWRVIRDWYPLALIPLAYWQMGWTGDGYVYHGLERSWVAFDKVLLVNWGLKEAIESLGPVIPGLLELSYTLVYPIPPVCLGLVYLCGRRASSERFLFQVMLSTLICYALYPWFPVHPPRFAFPGEDFPSVITVFREFNWLFLGQYAANTNVFPSGHVTAAFGAAFGLFRAIPDKRAVGWCALGAAAMISTATVYGRYHYAADVAAGAGIAAAVYAGVLACERLAPHLILTPVTRPEAETQ